MEAWLGSPRRKGKLLFRAWMEKGVRFTPDGMRIEEYVSGSGEGNVLGYFFSHELNLFGAAEWNG
jgi:hypothetical protein